MFQKTYASTSVEKIKGGAHQIHGTGKEDGSVIIQLCDDALMQSLDSQSQILLCQQGHLTHGYLPAEITTNSYPPKATETSIFFTEYAHGKSAIFQLAAKQ